jgi:hypothetical protein
MTTDCAAGLLFGDENVRVYTGPNAADPDHLDTEKHPGGHNEHLENPKSY